MPPRIAFQFVVCRAVSNAKRNGDFGFQEERLAIWPRLPVVLEPGRYRPFNFDNIAKQRNLNDKGKALAKALGDAIRWVGVPPARWAAPSRLAGIGNKDSR